MFFSININNGVAIYQQIVRQVKFAIAEGSLQPGQLLPGGRSLSVELAINPNTCLLYTSPSPRDATLSRMPSSA